MNLFVSQVIQEARSPTFSLVVSMAVCLHLALVPGSVTGGFPACTVTWATGVELVSSE